MYIPSYFPIVKFPVRRPPCMFIASDIPQQMYRNRQSFNLNQHTPVSPRVDCLVTLHFEFDSGPLFAPACRRTYRLRLIMSVCTYLEEFLAEATDGGASIGVHYEGVRYLDASCKFLLYPGGATSQRGRGGRAGPSRYLE